MGVRSACLSGSGKMLSANIRFVSDTSGILIIESTALMHLVVMLSYPGALPVGSRFIMSSRSFSVVVLKEKLSSPMSCTWLSIVVRLGWLSVLSILYMVSLFRCLWLHW